MEFSFGFDRDRDCDRHIQETQKIIDEFLGPLSSSTLRISSGPIDPFTERVDSFAQAELKKHHPDRAIRVTPEMEAKISLRYSLQKKKDYVAILEGGSEKPPKKELLVEMDSLLRFYGVMIKDDSEFKAAYRKDAFNLASKAYKLGSGVAAYILGDYFRIGFGMIQKDLKKASDLYLKATQRGVYKGVLGGTLAFIAHPDGGVGESQLSILKSFSQKGDIEASLMLGIFYYMGNTHLVQNYDEAYRLLRPIADLNCAYAQLFIGRMFLYGRGVMQDAINARYYLQKSVDGGNVIAQKYLDEQFQSPSSVVYDGQGFLML